MFTFGVQPMQRVDEFEARNQHALSGEYGNERGDQASGLIMRMKRTIQDGASRFWHWCISFVSSLSREDRLKEMDRRMLSLLEAEQALKDTLQKTEKAIELAPVKPGPFGSTGKSEYLEAVKTRAIEELQKVNNERITIFNQFPLVHSL